MPEAQLQIDEILIPLLRVSDEVESQRLIMQIINEHASPVIRDIIKYKLRRAVDRAENYARDNPDAEDTYHEVIVQLLARLKEFKADPQHKSISQLRSYVAVITYHTCYRYLRQIYPQRHILKNRLRYLLAHQAGFSLWEGVNREVICGFTAWREGRSVAIKDKVRQLSDDPGVLEQIGLLDSDAGRARPADVIAAVFAYVEGPLELDELVKIVARLWGIKDQQQASETEVDETELSASAQTDVAAEADRRDYLQRLWQEVCQLPLLQRAALLLNLREAEGRGCIELFHLAGVATIEQIAEALEIPTEQFASLWNELPLDDLTIAGRLERTRQQVINLRKAARARLARRMKNFE
jgi:RNA polymerase sigma factor (sigma-70 family)